MVAVKVVVLIVHPIKEQKDKPILVAVAVVVIQMVVGKLVV